MSPTFLKLPPKHAYMHIACIAALKLPQFCGLMRLCLFRKTAKRTYVVTKRKRQLHFE